MFLEIILVVEIKVETKLLEQLLVLQLEGQLVIVWIIKQKK